jgi:hypothetical protein
MTSQSCPRFDKCSAPICPLDPYWQKRVLLHDDPTCYYLTESVKGNAEAVFRSRGLAKLYLAMVEVTPTICSRHRRIEVALERAKLSGSRMARDFQKEKDHA